MNYELAKQLKDAGFPQEYTQSKKRYGKLVYIFGHKGLKVVPRPTIKQCTQMELVGLEVVCLPSLSELIEACTDLLPKGGTLVSGYCSDTKPPFEVSFNGQESASGETYEKAVAKLWLELNKKK